MREMVFSGKLLEIGVKLLLILVIFENKKIKRGNFD